MAGPHLNPHLGDTAYLKNNENLSQPLANLSQPLTKISQPLANLSQPLTKISQPLAALFLNLYTLGTQCHPGVGSGVGSAAKVRSVTI